jgi:hypothetical protein
MYGPASPGATAATTNNIACVTTDDEPLMRKFLMVAAAGIIAAAPLATPVAHADPSRCDQLHDPKLVQMCRGDLAELPAETTTQTIPSYAPCFSTQYTQQECQNRGN